MKNPIEYFDYEDRPLIVYFLSVVVCLAIWALPSIIHGRAESDSQKFQQIEKRLDLLEKAVVNIEKR